jgi:hypothetical protein
MVLHPRKKLFTVTAVRICLSHIRTHRHPHICEIAEVHLSQYVILLLNSMPQKNLSKINMFPWRDNPGKKKLLLCSVHGFEPEPIYFTIVSSIRIALGLWGQWVSNEVSSKVQQRVVQRKLTSILEHHPLDQRISQVKKVTVFLDVTTHRLVDRRGPYCLHFDDRREHYFCTHGTHVCHCCWQKAYIGLNINYNNYNNYIVVLII